MPGKLKVKVIAARGLPVMDRSSELTDAFVEIKLDGEVQKTDVFKRSLNPQWNSEWFLFEVDDEVLQDEPLELRVLDHDTYSAHDAVGKVYIDLNPLLIKESPSVISGWFPIYDTMHGIRGDLCVIVKLDLFSDFNKFRQSSCGIQFFCTAEVPAGFKLQYVHGFVEELVVNDDPEYQWIDKIRTPRASNEARQKLFSTMSGQLARKIGLKVLEMGGSAVIGYKECFDLEGESGIVIRGIGTAVTLIKLRDPQASPVGVSPLKDIHRSVRPQHFSMPVVVSTHANLHQRHSLHIVHPHVITTPVICSSSCYPVYSPSDSINNHSNPDTPTKTHPLHFSHPPLTAPPFLHSPTHPKANHSSHFAFDFTYSSPVPEDNLPSSTPPGQNARVTTSPVRVSLPSSATARRSSESGNGSPPKGNSVEDSNDSGSGSGTKNFPKLCTQQINIELMEYPLFTMTTYPPGFIVHIGGVVAARSVKLLDKIHNPEEPETRDAWWNEIRTEIRSHTRAMGCHAVIGYSELTSICDEIILLFATGTAAKVNLNFDQYQFPSSTRPMSQLLVLAVDRLAVVAPDKEREQGKKLYVDVNLANQMCQKGISLEDKEDKSPQINCSLCHIPYKPSTAPFPINLSQCVSCRRRYVPDILVTTINPPAEIQTIGKGAFIQARVCRPKAKSKAEANAKEVSDILPFLEYELHNQLVNKLKIRSMNGLFGLKMQFVVGESMLIGVATATGAYIVPLPAPPVPTILVQITSEEENVKLQELHIKIAELIQKNKDLYQLNVIDISSQPSPRSVTTEDSDDDSSDMDLSFNNKDTFVLEVDDAKDETIEAMLEDIQQPLGMELCNTETCPGISLRALRNNLQMFTQVFRRKIDLQQNLKLDFKEMFNSVYRRLFFKLRRMMPCCLYNLAFNIDAPLEDELEIIVTGVCVAIDELLNQSTSYIMTPMSTSYIVTPGSTTVTKPLLRTASNTDVSQVGVNNDCNEMMFALEEVTDGPGMSIQQRMSRQKSETTRKKPKQILIHNIGQQIQGIEITPLFYVPGCKIERYLGSYNFFFIRETTSVREIGGICGFMQKFIMEVLAIVRANVASLGGNALVAFNMAQCVLLNNEHKNQSQCLINVCGDAVYASKDWETAAVVPDTNRKQSDCLLSINVS